MQKQHPNYMLTPSTHFIIKTPEKGINTSPFRGCSVRNINLLYISLVTNSQ